jgi:hypothetical protein
MDGMKRLRLLFAASVLALAALGATSGSAAAYGRADQPLAQLELSANCNDPNFGLCQQVGLGGIWLWIEIDANGTGDIAGAGCGHDRAGTGGAGSIRGEIQWTSGSAADVLGQGGFLFGQDPANQYYIVALAPGEVFGFPKTVGHYSFAPVPAVTIQLQVAP